MSLIIQELVVQRKTLHSVWTYVLMYFIKFGELCDIISDSVCSASYLVFLF